MSYDPTDNDPDEKPRREKRLLNVFKQPVSKLDPMFVQSILPKFGSFNTFLKAKEPLIHILYHSTLRFYCPFLSRFMLAENISESNDMLRIDLNDPDVLKDFNSIFIGTMTKQYARSSDIISASGYKKFWKEVRFLLNLQST